MYKKVKTREKILLRALELFNAQGLERVGIRELARDLGLSPGNVSYYFSKKDDLVLALREELGELNSATLATEDIDSLTGLLQMLEQLFGNQYQYRFLVLSLVNLYDNNPGFREGYAAVQTARWQGLARQIGGLQSQGVLRKTTTELDIDRVVAHIALLSRFWLSEASVSWPDADIARVKVHYLHLVASIFESLVTKKGHAQLVPYLEAPLLV